MGIQFNSLNSGASGPACAYKPAGHNASALKFSGSVQGPDSLQFSGRRNRDHADYGDDAGQSRLDNARHTAKKWAFRAFLFTLPITLPLAAIQFVLAPFSAGITAITGVKTLLIPPLLGGALGFARGMMSRKE